MRCGMFKYFLSVTRLCYRLREKTHMFESSLFDIP